MQSLHDINIIYYGMSRDCRDWDAEDCRMLSLLLAVPSCIYSLLPLGNPTISDVDVPLHQSVMVIGSIGMTPSRTQFSPIVTEFKQLECEGIEAYDAHLQTTVLVVAPVISRAVCCEQIRAEFCLLSS